MKTRKSSIIAAFQAVTFFGGVFAAVPAGAQNWQNVPGLYASASPAIASHIDNNVYIAGVGISGELAYSTISTPGLWSLKSTIPGTPSVGLASETAPVFVSDGNLLYLFARGRDNELYETVKSGNGSFSSFSRWTHDGRVRGRITVSITHPPPVLSLGATPAPGVSLTGGSAPAPEIHVVHLSGADSVLYRSFNLTGTLTTSQEWSGVADGTVATDGGSAVGVALLRSAGVDMWWGHPGLRGGRAWTPLGTRAAAGSDGQVTDISNAVYFNGAFHVAYSLRTTTANTAAVSTLQLQHARFRPAVPDDGFVRVAFSTSAPAAPLLSEMRVYRNLLMLAFCDLTGSVRYERWDTADPSAPWVGGAAIGVSGQAGGRPALATFNVWGNVQNFLKNGFGNDLVAGIQGYGFAGTQFYFTNFSQEIARHEVGRQIGLFNAYSILGELSNGTPLVSCPAPPVQDNVPTTHVALSGEGRPVLTEIGAELWMLPNSLSSHIFRDAAMLAWSSKSPYFPHSSSALEPLVLMCTNQNDYVDNFGSTWVRVYDDNWALFQEFGHQLAGAIGLHDDSTGPNQSDATRSGIGLADLKQGYSIFGTSSDKCPNVPRCVGFTDLQYEWYVPDSNDAPSRQHHFLYVLLDYMGRGDELRQWVQQDIDGTNTATQGKTGERYLLQQKYNWVRWNIFRGVEFGQAGVLKTSF